MENEKWWKKLSGFLWKMDTVNQLQLRIIQGPGQMGYNIFMKSKTVK